MKSESGAAQVLASLVESLRDRCQQSPTLPGFDVVVDIAVLVSFADGQIDDLELGALQKTIQALSGGRLHEAQLSTEISACVEHLQARGPEEQARRLGEALVALRVQEEGVRFGVGVALISRGVSTAEHSALVHLANAAGVSQEQLERWLREMKQQLS